MAKGTHQSITIVGNLGDSPELRSTAGGTSVGNMSVAVTSYAGKDQQGNAIEHTEWFRCVLWGKLADNAAQYLSKGSKVLIVGEMRTRKWQDQQGVDRYSTELHAREMQFMGGNQQGQQGQQSSYHQQPAQPQQPAQSAAPAQQAQGGQGGGFDDFDDDKRNVA